jgi:hypothetical protein
LTNIPNATSSGLNTVPPRTGPVQYEVIVTNSYGSSTNSVVAVTVLPLSGTANVHVNVSNQLAVMPQQGLGVCAATYDNNLINSNIALRLSAAGISAVRFPGGSVADVYNWQNNGGIDGQYVNASDSFTNFMSTIVNPAARRPS